MVPTAEPTPADLSTRRLIAGSLRVGRTVGSDWTELQQDDSRSCPRLLPWPQVQNMLPPPLPVPAAPPPPQVTQSGSKSPANAPGEDPLPGAWSKVQEGAGVSALRSCWSSLEEAVLPWETAQRGEGPRKARRASRPLTLGSREGGALVLTQPPSQRQGEGSFGLGAS